MCDQGDSSLNRWLEGFDPSDPESRDEVLRRGQERVRLLTRRMLRGFPGLQRFEDTDDILQGALTRMDRAMRAIPILSAADFYRLAALQIRRELIDTVRGYRNLIQKYQTPQRDREGRELAPDEMATAGWEPEALAAWENFHREVDQLTEDQRTAFELIWYKGLTPAEAAQVMNVSEKTARRRSTEAQVRLVDAIGGNWPD